jgi:hypothetical protein
MEYMERKHRLWQGILLALIPALLFFPVVAFLTVCPPTYGIAGIRIAVAVFLSSEVWGCWKLFMVIQREVDWINGVAFFGMLMAVLVIVALAYGAAIARHAAVGPP